MSELDSAAAIAWESTHALPRVVAVHAKQPGPLNREPPRRAAYPALYLTPPLPERP